MSNPSESPHVGHNVVVVLLVVEVDVEVLSVVDVVSVVIVVDEVVLVLDEVDVLIVVDVVSVVTVVDVVVDVVEELVVVLVVEVVVVVVSDSHAPAIHVLPNGHNTTFNCGRLKPSQVHSTTSVNPEQ